MSSVPLFPGGSLLLEGGVAGGNSFFVDRPDSFPVFCGHRVNSDRGIGGGIHGPIIACGYSYPRDAEAAEEPRDLLFPLAPISAISAFSAVKGVLLADIDSA